MSAVGQKPTNGPQQKYDFVRFGPKADKGEHAWIVRYVPLAAVNAKRKTANAAVAPKSDQLLC
jgi:hypothetical protein